MLAAWFMVISGITTLLIAANKKQAEHVCKNIMVSIKGSGDKFYVEKDDVLKQLEKISKGSLINKSIPKIKLAALEKSLEKNQWIQDAELYFDREDVLHISIEEREPIARVFTTAGNSFYLDSSGHRMSLLDKVSVRVPVITGFTNAKKFNAQDSTLFNEVKEVARFVYTNEFWNAQIGQIDITPEGKFELMPVIGDHIIRIGTADKIEEKLGRLFIFYKQVMSKAGFNRYSIVDVQYEGQVIGINKGTMSVVDSIQLQKNIAELMQKNTLANATEEMLPDARPMIIPKTDSIVNTITVQTNSVPVKTNPIPAKKTNSVPKKMSTTSKPLQKPIVKKNSVKPKAIMQKRG